MRQITSWLLFIAFIGVTVTLLTQKCPPSVTQKPEIPSSILNNEIVSPDLPIIAYCELVKIDEPHFVPQIFDEICYEIKTSGV